MLSAAVQDTVSRGSSESCSGVKLEKSRRAMLFQWFKTSTNHSGTKEHTAL
jgi:hypothetical protein